MDPGDRPPLKVNLRRHSTREGLDDGHHKGRRLPAQILWRLVSAAVFVNPVVHSYALKRALLRMFGARIGAGVLIKPGVKISYPWHLTIGDYSWIGESAWLDSTSPLSIGKHAVISQGAYLCCGKHDWSDPGMGSVSAPITVEDGAWVAAFARVAGDVTIGQEAIVALGAVVFTDCEPRGTYQGNPARRVGTRRIRDDVGPKRPPPVRRRGRRVEPEPPETLLDEVPTARCAAS
ncbi:MAG TPA: WcaF family extracellular polysaccharide biosynthesis acetyltransferase [Solirubrobacteraceae bacterium]|nr:WcaF family extracellular polysaccharide biosynthesis acetyltransferase [Solirubrobacteraceae bacterium]